MNKWLIFKIILLQTRANCRTLMFSKICIGQCMQRLSDLPEDMTVGEAIDAGALLPLPSIKWSRISVFERARRDLSSDAREIADVIGIGLFTLLRKAHRRQGAKTGWLTIPRTIPSNHWIRAAVGDSAADALQAAVLDRTLDGKLDIRPRSPSARLERDDCMRYRYWSGASVADVACEFGVTGRHVRNCIS
ncbi:hypothetical protein [Burkholderia sp. HI2500]|uniref:hypothetical protein n=1 Tax=Burkholderia sp. HI2500 TaxID=2015358 RepID=UPI00117FD392|nr:hypothetical protein [Burkholderia sp. HI2500]